MDIMKQHCFMPGKKEKEEVCQWLQMNVSYNSALNMKKVYKIWSNAQEKKLAVLPIGLSLNDVWSLRIFDSLAC